MRMMTGMLAFCFVMFTQLKGPQVNSLDKKELEVRRLLDEASKERTCDALLKFANSFQDLHRNEQAKMTSDSSFDNAVFRLYKKTMESLPSDSVFLAHLAVRKLFGDNVEMGEIVDETFSNYFRARIGNSLLVLDHLRNKADMQIIVRSVAFGEHGASEVIRYMKGKHLTKEKCYNLFLQYQTKE